MTFKFVDLFAGIGGFHAALSALGGECVMASEIDKNAASVYKSNWGIEPVGDITEIANENGVRVPDHDVLVGGFPCQPFSKSGFQRGMDEAR
jgi:DNA (cytosine-5)-methyltransferase 1